MGLPIDTDRLRALAALTVVEAREPDAVAHQ
jgi:hypothetical protein